MENDQLVITDTNKSPLIQILIWVFLSISVVTVLIRIATKAAYIRKLGVDDIYILVALVSADSMSHISQVATDGYLDTFHSAVHCSMASYE